ncbi:hypothetical protein D3C80_1515880 [compost metagenome]
MIGFRVPAFAKAQAAGREPGCIQRVLNGFGLDCQRCFAGAHAHQLARFRALARGVLGGLGIDQGGAENLRRNRQLATVLRVNPVAQFDHAMTQVVDDLFIGPRFTQLFDTCIGNLQGRDAAVIV